MPDGPADPPAASVGIAAGQPSSARCVFPGETANALRPASTRRRSPGEPPRRRRLERRSTRGAAWRKSQPRRSDTRTAAPGDRQPAAARQFPSCDESRRRFPDAKPDDANPDDRFCAERQRSAQ
ncbi:hypothetical protein [Lignipirellula cremea]|uniref:hypothetical protein n=1 Tax=Lignipirellula cremea TaxID=2528010 RepID=UPI0011A00FD0|nr:hypothetical protein [Lignipirellula cremea]